VPCPRQAEVSGNREESSEQRAALTFPETQTSGPQTPKASLEGLVYLLVCIFWFPAFIPNQKKGQKTLKAMVHSYHISHPFRTRSISDLVGKALLQRLLP
jgi:hypothetical protein